MTTRQIVAGSGGFVPVPGLWGVVRPGEIFWEALRRSRADRPRVCLVMTASGDSPAYLATMYAAVTGVILALLVGSGRWSSMRLGAWRTWIIVGILVVTTAWSGIYYAAFGAILLVAATLWRFAAGAPGRQTLRDLVELAE